MKGDSLDSYLNDILLCGIASNYGVTVINFEIRFLFPNQLKHVWGMPLYSYNSRVPSENPGSPLLLLFI